MSIRIKTKQPWPEMTPQEAMEELVKETEILGLYDAELFQDNRPAKITIYENNVTACGNITDVEILSCAADERSALEMLIVDPVCWEAVMFPARYKVRRKTLALELHCLLVRFDDILEKLVFWSNDEQVAVDYVPPAIV